MAWLANSRTRLATLRLLLKGRLAALESAVAILECQYGFVSATENGVIDAKPRRQVWQQRLGVWGL